METTLQNQTEVTTVNSSQISESIFALSEQHVKANKIIEAITLLESIVQHVTKVTIDESSALKFAPQVVVKARLRIADLLLSFTENVEEAQSHLTKANILCGDAISLLETQLKIMSLIIHIHHLKGAIHLEKQVIQKGISLISNSLSSIPNSTNWLLYFHLRMVEALRKDETANPKEVLEHLNTGLELARKTNDPTSQTIYLLSRVQIHLVASRVAEAQMDLSEANQILVDLANSMKSSNNDHDSLLKLHDEGDILHQENGCIEEIPKAKIEFSNLNYMRMHCYTMTILFYLKRGDVKSASNELMKVHECVNIHENYHKQKPNMKLPYYWLTPVNFYSLIYLLSSVIYKSADVNTAMTMGRKGLDLVEANLSRELSSNGIIGIRKVIAIVDLLHFKLLFLQSLCTLCISQARYQDALKYLNTMHLLLQTYPMILSKTASTIHYLFGLLAHAMRDQQLAISHFETALKAASTVDLQVLCILCLCVCYFQTGLKDRASLLLQNSSSKGLLENHPNLLIRACSMFIQGVILLMQGHVSDSKVKLKDCLTMATEGLSNYQLAANALNILGEIFLSTERLAEAQSVITSSVNMCVNILDKVTLLSALGMLSIVNQKMHDPVSAFSNLESFNNSYQEHMKEIDSARRSYEYGKLAKFEEKNFSVQ